jgi:hypothetical protein
MLAPALFALALLADTAAAEPVATAPAEVVRSLPAEEARQGVAVDAAHVYAIDNARIGKYDKRTGRKVGAWSGDPALFPHLNSCSVLEARLVCASSNYPATPMTSSVEIFDPETLDHVGTVSLGPGTGSLTWVARKDGFWWATFANYDERGGDPGRDHRSTVLVKFDDDWRRVSAWLFPQTVLARFAPKSSSGGVWGPDGLLYVTGHDARELYVLALPEAGGTLRHVATIPVATPGQAIAWDDAQGRLWGIDRAERTLVEMRLPSVAAQ